MLKTVLSRIGSRFHMTTCPIIPTNARFFASFRNRDFQLDRTDPETSGHLSTRFARHVAIQNASNKDPIKYTIRYADYYPVSNIRTYIDGVRKIPVEQLPQMIVYTSIYKGRSEVPTFVDVMNHLDDECAKKIDEMSQQQIMECLNAFMYLLPERIFQLDFYRQAISRLVQGFTKGGNAREFVDICYYLGQAKKQSQNLIAQFFNDYLGEQVEAMQTMDVAIVANAAYKSSTRITNKKFLERIKSEMLSMEDVDVSLLITYMKCLRHNRVQCPEAVARFIKFIETDALNGGNVDIRAVAHFLVYLTENRVSNYKITSKLIERGVRMVNYDTRVADISNLLWTISNLGYTFEDESAIKRVIQTIFDKIDDGHYRYDNDSLIDTCLSLWKIGYKSQGMAKECLQMKQDFYKKNPERIHLDSRKILLKKLVDLERRPLQIVADVPEYLVNQRKELQTVFETLKNTQEEFGVTDMRYCLLLQELNVAGIHVEMGDKELFVEVLDNSNTLDDNKTPMGMMRLKKQILEDKKCFVVFVNVAGVVDKEQIEQITKDEIRDFLDVCSSDEDEKGSMKST